MRSQAVTAVCLGALVLVSTISTSEEGPDAAPPFTAVDVSPSVVMALNDNGSNISCVAVGDGLVFFDASLSTRTAEHFRRDMEQRFDRRTTALVLTHAHLDHVLGMGAFADVPIHAAAAGRPRWEDLVAIEWDEKAIARYATVFPTLPQEIEGARLTMPSNWFDDELVLGSGDDRLVIRRTGGHSVDSSVAIVGAGEVVIAGDLVQARRRPYFGEPDTDFDAWISAMRSWEALRPAAVCPGHGPVTDRAELAEIRTWFEAMRSSVESLKSDGLTVEEVFFSDRLPAGYWPEEDAVPRWWGFCVKALYDAS